MFLSISAAEVYISLISSVKLKAVIQYGRNYAEILNIEIEADSVSHRILLTATRGHN